MFNGNKRGFYTMRCDECQTNWPYDMKYKSNPCGHCGHVGVYPKMVSVDKDSDERALTELEARAIILEAGDDLAAFNAAQERRAQADARAINAAVAALMFDADHWEEVSVDELTDWQGSWG